MVIGKSRSELLGLLNEEIDRAKACGAARVVDIDYLPQRDGAYGANWDASIRPSAGTEVSIDCMLAFIHLKVLLQKRFLLRTDA